MRPLQAQYGAHTFVSEYETILFFKGRFATLGLHGKLVHLEAVSGRANFLGYLVIYTKMSQGTTVMLLTENFVFSILIHKYCTALGFIISFLFFRSSHRQLSRSHVDAA